LAATTTVLLDPVSLAVVRNGLIACTRKAFVAFRRTGMIRSSMTGTTSPSRSYDARFNLVAESAAIPLFAGALGDTVRGS